MNLLEAFGSAVLLVISQDFNQHVDVLRISFKYVTTNKFAVGADACVDEVLSDFVL